VLERGAQVRGWLAALASCALLPVCSASSQPAASGGSAGQAANAGAEAGAGGGNTSTGGSTSSAGDTSPGGNTSTGGSTSSGGDTSPGGNTNTGGSAGDPNLDAGASGTGGVPEPDSSCALAARGIAIHAAWDPLGYPPYALDACNLAYIAVDGTLQLRDLASGLEQRIDDAESSPRRPTMAHGTLAWEVELEGRSQVRIRAPSGTVTLSGAFDHAAEPKACRDAVAFTAFAAMASDSDTDVLLYDVTRGTIEVVFGGAGQQRFADISEQFVAGSDFSEDPNGTFDPAGSLADIVLLTRADGQLIRRAKAGKQAFPMLGDDGVLSYLHWNEVHPEPKFNRFDLFVGRGDTAPESDVLLRDIQTDPSYVRPSIRGAVVDFVDTSSGRPTLYRAALAPLAEPVLMAQGSATERLLGPTGTEAWTVLGKQRTNGVVLEVVAR
jgi:hypothetical protein